MVTEGLLQKFLQSFSKYLPTEGDVGARHLLNGGNYKVTEIVCQGSGERY